jgi:hypothetical protein
MLGTKYDVPHLFIDFQAGYDTVWRKEIRSEMYKLGFPETLVKLCRILNNIYGKVKISEHYPLHLTLSNPIFLPTAYSPALIYFSYHIDRHIIRIPEVSSFSDHLENPS